LRLKDVKRLDTAFPALVVPSGLAAAFGALRMRLLPHRPPPSLPQERFHRREVDREHAARLPRVERIEGNVRRGPQQYALGRRLGEQAAARIEGERATHRGGNREATAGGDHEHGAQRVDRRVVDPIVARAGVSRRGREPGSRIVFAL
jgi:hypothetical protein